MKYWYFVSQLTILDLNKNHYSFFMLKIDDVLTNQVLFFFEMIKYTSFAEINMNLWLLQKHS